MALLLVLPDLRVILDVPAVVSIEGKPGGEPVRLGAQPLIEREHQLAVWGRDANVVALVRVTRPVIRESRHVRSEEHTSELQSHLNLVCRLLLEKKKTTQNTKIITSHHLTPLHPP